MRANEKFILFIYTVLLFYSLYKFKNIITIHKTTSILSFILLIFISIKYRKNKYFYKYGVFLVPVLLILLPYILSFLMGAYPLIYTQDRAAWLYASDYVKEKGFKSYLNLYKDYSHPSNPLNITYTYFNKNITIYGEDTEKILYSRILQHPFMYVFIISLLSKISGFNVFVVDEILFLFVFMSVNIFVAYLLKKYLKYEWIYFYFLYFFSLNTLHYLLFRIDIHIDMLLLPFSAFTLYIILKYKDNGKISMNLHILFLILFSFFMLIKYTIIYVLPIYYYFIYRYSSNKKEFAIAMYISLIYSIVYLLILKIFLNFDIISRLLIVSEYIHNAYPFSYLYLFTFRKLLFFPFILWIYIYYSDKKNFWFYFIYHNILLAIVYVVPLRNLYFLNIFYLIFLLGEKKKVDNFFFYMSILAYLFIFSIIEIYRFIILI